MTVFITKAKIALRRGISLFSGFSIPFHSLGIIFGYAVAIIITTAKLALRKGITLLSGFAQPFHSLGKVSGYAVA